MLLLREVKIFSVFTVKSHSEVLKMGNCAASQPQRQVVVTDRKQKLRRLSKAGRSPAPLVVVLSKTQKDLKPEKCDEPQKFNSGSPMEMKSADQRNQLSASGLSNVSYPSYPIYSPELAAVSAETGINDLDMSQTIVQLPPFPGGNSTNNHPINESPSSPFLTTSPDCKKTDSSGGLSFEDSDAWVDHENLTSEEARKLLMRLAEEELSLNRVESLYIAKDEKRRSIQLRKMMQSQSKSFK